MKVTVLLFAGLRERAGTAALELGLADGATVEALLAELAHRSPALDIAPRQLVVAVNREYSPTSRRLNAGDEVALIPPVSGGAGDVHAEPGDRVRAVELSDARLDVSALTALVGDHTAGAVVTFQGTTRDVPALLYEAYAAMALEAMRSIAADVAQRHGLAAIAVAHRIGEVPLGEPSVVVAAAAAHREEAFAGAREAIDRVKCEAPIWKAELDESGATTWVEGTLPPTSG